MEETFKNRIEELKLQSVGNITRTYLLNSTDNVEFIVKAIIDESLLKTQIEFFNHWSSLVQKMARMRKRNKNNPYPYCDYDYYGSVEEKYDALTGRSRRIWIPDITQFFLGKKRKG